MAAATTMKVDIITRETIKPSSPTPETLRHFKLSIMDQTAPVMYTALLLFYSANDDKIADTKSQHLKTSLSRTLTRLYPLGGVIKDQITIECNDNGAEFVEARVSCRLSDILEQPPDSVLLRNFLPVEPESTEAGTGRVLFVQANFFKCGGFVIGVCISHKIADASTMSTFINSWSATAAADHPSTDSSHVSPLFTSSSIFPPLDTQVPTRKLIRDNCVTRRYVFNTSSLASLKAKASSSASFQQQPIIITRVEAVTALIWKCILNVTRSKKHFPKLSLVSHSVDLRKRVVPPLPENAIGNIVGMFFSSQVADKETDLSGLVSELRKGKMEFNKNGLEIINVEKKTWTNMSPIRDFPENIEYFSYTSWCRFPIYEADFGWGNPIWATFPNIMMKNLVVLLDTRDGEGIEALVAMSKEDTTKFECEKELLEFACVNPSVLVDVTRE